MIKARRRCPLALDEVTAVVRAHFGLHESDLRRRSHPRLPRSTFAWLARRYTDRPLRERAARVGLRGPTACPACYGLRNSSWITSISGRILPNCGSN